MTGKVSPITVWATITDIASKNQRTNRAHVGSVTNFEPPVLISDEGEQKATLGFCRDVLTTHDALVGYQIHKLYPVSDQVSADCNDCSSSTRSSRYATGHPVILFRRNASVDTFEPVRFGTTQVPLVPLRIFSSL